MTTATTQDDAPVYEVKFDSEFSVWMIYTFSLDGNDDTHADLVALRDTEAQAHEVANRFKSLESFDARRAARKHEEAQGGEEMEHLHRHLHRLLWRYGVGNQEAPAEPPVYGPEW